MDIYRNSWTNFFWLTLRTVAVGVVTTFLFFLIVTLYDEDDPYGALEWIGMFMVVAICITAPVLLVYTYSVIRLTRMKTRVDVVFLVFHCLNLIQMIAVVAVSHVSQKEFTPKAMEVDYKKHQTQIAQLIAHTRSWMTDSTGFSIGYSRHGRIIDWGIDAKEKVKFCAEDFTSDTEKNRELQKVGLSIARLDSLGTALLKMGYRGIYIGNHGHTDYTQITYATDGNTSLYYRIYDKPLTDSLIHDLNCKANMVVFNRYVVFYCLPGILDSNHFPDKEEYIKEHIFP